MLLWVFMTESSRPKPYSSATAMQYVRTLKRILQALCAVLIASGQKRVWRNCARRVTLGGGQLIVLCVQLAVCMLIKITLCCPIHIACCMYVCMYVCIARCLHTRFRPLGVCTGTDCLDRLQFAWNHAAANRAVSTDGPSISPCRFISRIQVRSLVPIPPLRP